MPIEIKDLDGGIGVLITASDPLEEKEYVDALRKHLTQGKAKFRRYRYTLIDYTGLTKVNVSSNAIQQVADMCKIAAIDNSEIIIGISAPKDVVYGMSRMSQIMMDATGWEHEVFRKRKNAEDWIKERVRAKFGIGDLTMA